MNGMSSRYAAAVFDHEWIVYRITRVWAKPAHEMHFENGSFNFPNQTSKWSL